MLATLFGRKARCKARLGLDAPLLSLGNGETISVSRAMCGVFITGQTGSRPHRKRTERNN